MARVNTRRNVDGSIIWMASVYVLGLSGEEVVPTKLAAELWARPLKRTAAADAASARG